MFCILVIACGQPSGPKSLSRLAAGEAQNLGSSGFEDPVLYRSIDISKESLIWLPVPESTAANNSFLVYENRLWRPYKAYTIVRMIDQAFSRDPRRILEGGWYLKDPLTRLSIDSKSMLLLSSPFQKGFSKVKIHHKAFSQRSLRTRFFIGDFSEDGHTQGYAIAFLSDSDAFTEAKFSAYKPVGKARTYFLEHPDYFKEGEYSMDGKFKTSSWHFPNGSWFSFIYDDTQKKTGLIQIHTIDGVEKTIRYCDFPKYIPLGSL